jgi:hypothetical protein
MRGARPFVSPLVRLSSASLLVAGTAVAQGATVRPPRIVHASRSASAITVDGRLVEPVWVRAAPATDFRQQRPEPEREASQRTEARVVVDDATLYVAIRALDTAPDSIAGPLLRRDGEGYSDWVHVLVDSYLDRRTAFRFAVNPSGVKRDALISNDEEWSEDSGWDAVWEAETARDSLGWTAEIRIPLSQLRFRACRERCRWGIQFARDVARRGERSLWSPIPAGAAGFTSRFGDLDGIDGLRAPRRAEIAPYTIAQHTDAGSAVRGRNASRVSGGADLKLGVTPNITLTGTVNPDFGQVEADPSEVNLTATETFFSERRPFFVEGSEIFAVRMTSAGWVFGEDKLFYSRRVGRAPQRSIPDDAEAIDPPQATTILGAAKLAGKTAGGWSIGALSAVTGGESAEITDARGDRERFRLEPMTHYGVARIARDFLAGRAAFGAALSSTNRRIGDHDAFGFLHTSATVGGLDWRWRTANGNYGLGGNVFGSIVRGSPEAITRTQRSSVHLFQRPDAHGLDVDSSRTSLGGLSAEVRAAKNGGGSWRWGIVGRVVTPGFEMNDVGYQPRSDVVNSAGWVGFDHYNPSRHFRRWALWSNHWAQWSLTGERQTTGSDLFADIQLANYWTVNSTIARMHPSLSTTVLRGGPAVYQPGRVRWFVRVSTDDRRPLTLGLRTSGFLEDGDTGHQLGIFPSLNARPSTNSTLSIEPGVSTVRSDWQYVETAKDAEGRAHHSLAALRQLTWSLTARASYVFTPNLSFQLYAQPFVSAGRYDRYREVAAARAHDLDARFPRVAGVARAAGVDHVDIDGDGRAEYSIEDPDFTVRELRANAVVRWEYRPGSTLFVVWSQQRSRTEEIADLHAWRDPGALMRTPGPSVLLVKLSYWLKR